MVNGRPCAIVGVAPADFSGTFAFSESELYLPLNWQSGEGFDDRRARGCMPLRGFGTDVTIENAQAAMNVVAERLARQYPDSNANLAIRVLPERLARPEEDQFRTNALGAAIMLAMVILVMIVAAVNVTNLLLARAAGRYRELAIRSALGAGRGRLVRQMVTESLLLAILVEEPVSFWGPGSPALLATIRLPGDLPVRFDFRLDGRVLAYAVTVAAVTGLLGGSRLQQFRVSGGDLDRVLRGSRDVSVECPPSGDPRLPCGGSARLVVSCSSPSPRCSSEACSEAKRADLGFPAGRALSISTWTSASLDTRRHKGGRCSAKSNSAVRSIPGVQNVSFAFTIPMGYVRVGDRSPGRGASGRLRRTSDLRLDMNMVSPEYFQTLGIQIVRGRSFVRRRQRAVAVSRRHQRAPCRHAVARPGRYRSAIQVTRTGILDRGRWHSPEHEQVRIPLRGTTTLLLRAHCSAYSGLRVLQVRASLPPAALAPAVERTIRASRAQPAVSMTYRP